MTLIFYILLIGNWYAKAFWCVFCFVWVLFEIVDGVVLLQKKVSRLYKRVHIYCCSLWTRRTHTINFVVDTSKIRILRWVFEWSKLFFRKALLFYLCSAKNCGSPVLNECSFQALIILKFFLKYFPKCNFFVAFSFHH